MHIGITSCKELCWVEFDDTSLAGPLLVWIADEGEDDVEIGLTLDSGRMTRVSTEKYCTEGESSFDYAIGGRISATKEEKW